MDFNPALRQDSEVPLYRQLFEQMALKIRSGAWPRGERLPATRELAGQLGLNRTTISAAYELLEAEGLITGQVGRGSFVTGTTPDKGPGVDWSAALERGEGIPASHSAVSGRAVISFAMSRPSRALFPLDDFRSSCTAVLSRPDLADILQLGSPSGYEPLRRYLLDDARHQGAAAPGDDLLITNGCQQALDLIGRVLLRPGDPVAVEEPIYTGLKSLLGSLGAQLIGIPVGPDGMDVGHLERVLERDRPRLLVVTPNFQNPTGATIPLAQRHALLEAARKAGVPVIENDAYGELRYRGDALPSVKQLDEQGGTVLLRSFSKVSFPGLRVGWALGPKPLIDRLRQAKESSDLHTDQLSQAVLLDFAESGRLEAHRARVLQAGAERLDATLESCRRYLPAGARWTRPEGGMNVWVKLPEPLDAGELLQRAQQAGVAYLPGKYFAVSKSESGSLRLSFAGLTPENIREGLAILGRVFAGAMENGAENFEPASAMV
ncbi:MAG TPA: PLP-dependent aminotransferase family protein [Candidatus Sulfopaludibacter sp.]|jgi:DNA-binding transcriptional MocR family regulator|nr:PLP-dependent aminotransferase family protein [Candidatus Sulfopaludibacter sp.]